jgi:hypothetical protein
LFTSIESTITKTFQNLHDLLNLFVHELVSVLGRLLQTAGNIH